ncbi:MAG: hypothetical protein ABI548_15990 [Polyangiaceae bacterium]
MKRIYAFAAMALLASLTITPLAFGQSTAAAQAARLKRLQDQQAAVLARVKAAQVASSAAAAQPTATPTVAPLPTPTAVPTTATTGTVAPKPSATAAASAKPATSASAVTSASAAPVPVALALNIEALRKTRADRRHAEFTTLQARWGSLLSDPHAADELKLHAQRSAYLQRIRALGSKDTAFVSSVDALITKEDTRDADAMNALRTGALPAAAAPAAAGATK